MRDAFPVLFPLVLLIIIALGSEIMACCRRHYT